MKKRLNIELFEEHEYVNFYTYRFNENEAEFNKFLDKFPEGTKFDKDINIIIKWIDKIGKTGALERYLRPEGKIRDNVYAIPIETSKLRLYVLRINNNIVILGNGGRKKTKAYNEDQELLECVSQLQELDRLLKLSLRKSKTHIYQKQLFGKLDYEI